MAQTSFKKKVSKTIDATGANTSPWYLDFHLPNGGCDERVHLFFQDRDHPSFKDCGIVKELKKDCSDLEMSPCVGIKLLNGDCYLVEPMVFAWSLVKVVHDGVTMPKAGWVEPKEDTPSENLLDLFIESFKKVTQYSG